MVCSFTRSAEHFVRAHTKIAHARRSHHGTIVTIDCWRTFVEFLMKGDFEPPKIRTKGVRTEKICYEEKLPMGLTKQACFEVPVEVEVEREANVPSHALPFVPTPCTKELLMKIKRIVKNEMMKKPYGPSRARIVATAIWYACNPNAPLDPLMNDALRTIAEHYQLPELCKKAYEVLRPVEDVRLAVRPSALPLSHLRTVRYGFELISGVEWPKPSNPTHERESAFWMTMLRPEVALQSIVKTRPDALQPPGFLYDVQRKVFAEAIARLLVMNGATIQAPTGFGKTVVASAILDRLFELDEIEKATVLVPRRVLVSQWERSLERFCERCNVGKNVVVTTYQAVYYWIKRLGVNVRRQATSFLFSDPLVREDEESDYMASSDRVRRDVVKYFESDMVVLDEVHGVKASTFSLVLDSNKKAVRLGLSATPEWLKAKYHTPALEILVGPIVEGPRPSDLIERGVLAQFIVYTIGLGPVGCGKDPPSKCFGPKGRGTAKACELLVSLLRRPDVRSLLGPKWAVMVTTKALGECVAKRLDLPFAYSRTRDVLEAIRPAKSGAYVVTAQLIQEGYDDPNLTAIVIADPVSNPPRLKQMLGRVLRTSESKRTAVVLDVCWRDWAKGCERRYKVYEEVGGEVRPLMSQ